MARKRDVFLEDIPLDEAWARLRAALAEKGLWEPFPAEEVPVRGACGRVTAASVWARLSSPPYHSSAMDGYAVRAVDTQGATETHPVVLHETKANLPQTDVLRPALPVNTGHPLPAWADAVIMVEHIEPIGDGTLEIRAPVAPWQHVRPMGEDMVRTELVLPANHLLCPVDLGALAASGHPQVQVRRQPSVSIVPTGSELVTVEEAARGLARGKIVESNSAILAAQVESWGATATRSAIVPDRRESIQAAVEEAAAEHDLVLVIAGSSAGTEDYTASVVRDLGRLLVHGVAVRPGHPVIFGLLGKGPTPVIGVPGYPVSAALTGEIFIKPLLDRWLGRPPHRPQKLTATLSRKVSSPTGDDDYLRVAVGRVGERTIAAPLAGGAGVVTSLVRADGIVRIPRFTEGFNSGDPVTVELYRHPDEIDQTILAIGSHDMTLDLMAQWLAEQQPGLRLASGNAGSIGGLLALRRGEAHLAGSHLLDLQTGEYNLSYIEQYLPDRDVILITLVEREQGLMVAPGNPQNVRSVDDLVREDIRIVNRQRGSGTRLLLDYELGKRGIQSDQVSGYSRTEHTHLAVAAAVASRTADCGLGVRAAARALDLDFVPVANERYDLVIPREHYESDLLAPLLKLLHNPEFRKAVVALPGYNVGPMGRIVGR